MGNPSKETVPAMRMTIERTEEKIGRSMKKLTTIPSQEEIQEACLGLNVSGGEEVFWSGGLWEMGLT